MLQTQLQTPSVLICLPISISIHSPPLYTHLPFPAPLALQPNTPHSTPELSLHFRTQTLSPTALYQLSQLQSNTSVQFSPQHTLKHERTVRSQSGHKNGHDCTVTRLTYRRTVHYNVVLQIGSVSSQLCV